MAKIKIKTCKECKSLNEEQDYTADSFETCFKGKCREKDKYVFRYRDWNEQYPLVPDWCPKKPKKKRKKEIKNMSKITLDLKKVIEFAIIGIKNGKYEESIYLLEEVLKQWTEKSAELFEKGESFDLDSYVIELRKKSIGKNG